MQLKNLTLRDDFIWKISMDLPPYDNGLKLFIEHLILENFHVKKSFVRI